ncbi:MULTISPECIES: AraC family transcriptional regulator [Rhizobium/Agrobacterium group]|uniref:Transcriptional regulator AraC family n=2 Tax=Rhizobium/Agrobacterium group TaxID=227290 RepID=B9K594_ALLAM|nr:MULTISPECIES: AraC family transcriptional regulator [Rhizobium/Agrobacterium group]ACM40042.1 transcriptional regulator AraC family [Allorhizobium ampelinum S4]MCF1493702.1 AraC family transcriptional regulator [Allorhizobium ampelinum]MUO28483.1 helix-turn-helix domain-containing protein [Agrobacterium vitis]MUO41365.1 helix-turn-helix domain-containing protein [Agrobacterium vitis]MUP08969.1 helix-turn-helix domain-containing protein [Agrobacterium vitis]
MSDHSSQRLSPSNIPMDALSEVLQDFRLSGVNYGRCELRHPWSIALPHQQLLRFHFVSQGPCWIHTEAQGWQELNDGDLVLLPQGIAHRLASAPDVEGDSLKSCQIKRLSNKVCELVREGTGATSTLFCGSMALSAYALDPLIALMPPIIKGCDVAGNDPVIGPLLAAMTAEASQPQMGSATILSRMADLLVARLIRCWVNCSGAATTGWLAAIRDPHLGRVLAAMHRDPGHNWTLESLAGVAGQSRSIFAERFSAILGEGAARYLARLRMQLARELLGQGGMSVAEVASRLGYESEASFARAFKRITTLSPGVVRRTVSGRTDMVFGF